MASKFEIPPMDFESASVGETWRRWKQTMELMLSGPLSGKEEKEQCSYFLLHIGQTGRDIFNTWKLSEQERDKIKVLFDKFSEHCLPQQNTTVMRFRFYSRNNHIKVLIHM